MMMMMVVMITMMVMKEGRGRGQKGRGLSEGRGLRDGFEEGGEKGGGVKRGEGFERGNSPFSIPTLSSNTPKKIISLTPFFCFFFFFPFMQSQPGVLFYSEMRLRLLVIIVYLPAFAPTCTYSFQKKGRIR